MKSTGKEGKPVIFELKSYFTNAGKIGVVSMPVTKCPNCDTYISPGAAICTFCGHPMHKRKLYASAKRYIEGEGYQITEETPFYIKLQKPGHRGCLQIICMIIFFPVGLLLLFIPVKPYKRMISVNSKGDIVVRVID
jgi:hypothetical protein